MQISIQNLPACCQPIAFYKIMTIEIVKKTRLLNIRINVHFSYHSVGDSTGTEVIIRIKVALI